MIRAQSNLSLKVFSLVNNDAHIMGSRLEGGYSSEMIESLLQFSETLKDNEEEKIANLYNKIESVKLPEKLRESSSLHQEIYGLDNEEKLESFKQELTDKINSLKKSDNMFMPGGWVGRGEGEGHGMQYEFYKNEDGKLYFIVYNAGDGVQFHQYEEMRDKIKYAPVKMYEISTLPIDNENLNYFLECLFEPIMPYKNRYILKKNKYSERIEVEKQYNGVSLYEEILSQIAYIEGHEIAPTNLSNRYNEITVTTQRSGTCSEKSLHCILKTCLTEEESRLFLFLYKISLIKRLYNENKENMNSEIREQILFAIQNITKSHVKYKKFYPENRIKTDLEIIKKIKNDLMNYDKKEKTEKIIVKPNFIPLPPLKKVFKEEKIVNKKETAPDITYVDKIDCKPLCKELNTDLLNSFLQEIKRLVNKGTQNSLLAARESIEDLFLNIPFDRQFYLNLNSPEKVEDILNCLSRLFQEYKNLDILNIQGGYGRDVIAKLSIITIINQIKSNSKMAITTSLEPLFSNKHESEWASYSSRKEKESGKNLFLEFIETQQNNPFLATYDNNYDIRLSAIRECNEQIMSSTPQYSRMECYLNYLDENKKLESFLKDVYKEAESLFHEINGKDITYLKELEGSAQKALYAYLVRNDDYIERAFKKIIESKKYEKIRSTLEKEMQKQKFEFQFNAFTCDVLSDLALGKESREKRDRERKEIWRREDLEQSKSSNIKDYSSEFWELEKGKNVFIKDPFHSKLLLERPKNEICATNKANFLSFFKGETSTEIGNELNPDKVVVDLYQKYDAYIFESEVQSKFYSLVRSSTNTQILSTIEVYKSNMGLLSNDSELIYLRTNIFQPNLITQAIFTNDYFYSTMIKFFNEAIQFYKNKKNKVVINNLYRMKLDFCKYVSSFSTKYSKETREEIQKMRDILKKDDPFYVQTYLEAEVILFDEKKSDLLDIIDKYFEYKELLPNDQQKKQKEVALMKDYDLIRDIQYQNTLAYSLIDKLKDVDRETIKKSLQEYFKKKGIHVEPNEGRRNEDIFPCFRFHDDNQNDYFVDLMQGRVYKNNIINTVVPESIASTELFKFISGKTRQTAFASRELICGTLYNKYEFESKKGIIEYYTLGYGNEQVHNIDRDIVRLTQEIQGKKISFQYSKFSRTEFAKKLPKTFNTAESCVWISCEDDGQKVIEREGERYLCDAGNRIFKLDHKGNKTGYELINMSRAKSIFPTLIDKLSQFENELSLEILENHNDSYPKFVIKIPRYSIELNVYHNDDSKKWEIENAQDPDWVMSETQFNPISDYRAALTFVNKNTSELASYFPMQEFYLVKKEELEKKKRSPGDTAYLALTLDNDNHINERLIKDEKILGNPEYSKMKNVWSQSQSQKYMKIPFDSETGEYHPVSIEQSLYLAYVFSCKHEPEKAIKLIVNIQKAGGIKGTLEEISLIEKILDGIPRVTFGKSVEDSKEKQEKLMTPELTSVRLHASSLITHFLELGGVFPKIKSREASEENVLSDACDTLVTKKCDTIIKNHKALSEEIFRVYANIENNLASDFKMPKSQQFEILKEIFWGKKSLYGPLAHRYIDLQSEFLEKEKVNIESLGDQDKNERLEKIKEKLDRTHFISIKKKTHASEVEIFPKVKNWSPTIGVEKSLEEGLVATEKEASDLIKLGSKSVHYPTAYTTEIEFCKHTMYYMDVLLNGDSFEKNNLIKAFKKIIDANIFKYHFKSDEDSVCKKSPPLTFELALRLFQIYQSGNIEKLYDDLKKENEKSTFLEIKTPLKEKNRFGIFHRKKEKEKEKEKEETKKTRDSLSLIRDKKYAALNTPINILPLIVEPSIVTQKYSKKQSTVTFKKPIVPIAREFEQLKNELISECDLTSFILEVNSLNDKRDREVMELRKKFSTEGRFEDTFEKNEELDSQVGHLIHQYDDKINSKFNVLNDDEKLKKIKKQTSEMLDFCLKVQHDRLIDILELANSGPRDANEKLNYDFELLSGTRKKIEVADLNRLYVQSDLEQYKNLTGLSDEQCKTLHNMMANYVDLSISKNQFEQIQKSLSNFSENKDANEALIELGQSLCQTNVCDFYHDPELQFFQMAQSMTIFPSRIASLKKLLHDSNGEYKNEVVQVMMGGGKTKVLSPLANVLRADGNTLLIFQVKKNLFETNFQDLNQTSLSLFGQEAIPFQYERANKFNALDFKKMYHRLHKAMVQGDYIVTTGDSLQALQLKYVELINKTPFYEHKELKWVEKTLKLILNGNRIIDEIHDELDPRKRLNYTLEDECSIPKEDINFHVDIFDFLTRNNKRFQDVLEGRKILTEEHEFQTLINDLSNLLVTHRDSPIRYFAQELLASDQKMLISYLTGESDQVPFDVKEVDTITLNKLGYLKNLISEVMPFTLSRKLGEHYGPSLIKKGLTDPYIMIPYAANNDPVESSQFGNFLESMNYVIQAAHRTEISDEIIEKVIDKFTNKANSEIESSVELQYSETDSYYKFKHIFNINIDFHKVQYDVEYRQDLIRQLKISSEFKKYALKNIILPQIKINPYVLASNPINLFSMTKTTNGLTGTPWNVYAMHRDLHFDKQGGLGTNGQTTELIRKKAPKTSAIEPFESVEKFMRQYDTNPNFRAMIDVGALFKGLTNEAIAKSIAQYYQEKPGNEIKYVLYFDTLNKKLHAINIESGEKILLNTTDEKNISKILKCKPNERFTYYDQASTTGIDIVQSAKADAVVTLGEDTTRSRFYQGLRRMRMLDKGQTVRFAYPAYLAGNRYFSGNDPLVICEFTKKNEEKEALNLHLMGALQNFQDVIRNQVLSMMYDTSDIDIKHALFQNFKNYFINTMRYDYFNQWGGITSINESEKYFNSIKDKARKDFDDGIAKAKVYVSEQDRTRIYTELDNLTKRAIQYCADKIEESKNDQTLGSNVEVKVDVKSDEKIMLENQNQEQLENQEQVEKKQHDMFISVYKGLFVPSAKMDSPKKILANIRNNTIPLQTLLEGKHPDSGLSFSHDIFLSDGFVDSYIIPNEPNNGMNFDFFTKPIEVIMMIRSHTNPPDTKAVVLKKWGKEFDEAILRDLSTRDSTVWFTTPSGLILSGKPPEELTSHEQSMMEQIKYLNGDCSLLVKQKEDFLWIKEEAQLDFLKNTILNVPGREYQKIIYLPYLKSRISCYSQIMSRIRENPETDFSKFDWAKEYSGYHILTPLKKRQIKDLANNYKMKNKKAMPSLVEHKTVRPEGVQFQRQRAQRFYKSKPMEEKLDDVAFMSTDLDNKIKQFFERYGKDVDKRNRIDFLHALQSLIKTIDGYVDRFGNSEVNECLSKNGHVREGVVCDQFASLLQPVYGMRDLTEEESELMQEAKRMIYDLGGKLNNDSGYELDR